MANMRQARDLVAGLLAIGLTVGGSSASCQTVRPTAADEQRVFKSTFGAAQTARMDLVTMMDRMDGAHADQSTLPLRTCIHRLEYEVSEIVRIEWTMQEDVAIRDHMTEAADQKYMDDIVRNSAAATSRLLTLSKPMDFDKTYQKCSSYPDFNESASRVSELYVQAQALLTQLQAPDS